VEAAYPDRLLVRRPTGGFAVEHGDDLTISIVTREEWLPADTPRGVMGSYRKISGALTAALNRSGVAATLGAEAGARRTGLDAEAGARRTMHVVDCFAVSAACDIVEPGTGKKLLGAAQRREKGVLLQQMSLPKRSLRDIPAFIVTLKEEFAHALGVSQWV
jgi:lipoate-protein ligase A